MSFRLFTCLGLKKKVQIQLHLQLLRKLYVNNPVVMDRCERWTTKKAEHRRIDAFELWCWRRLLRIPWIERGSNQSLQRKSVLNIHWKDRCWSWSSNTLATWCKEPTHWKRPWCWDRLKAGEEGDRGWDGWMASLTQWTWVWASSRRSWRTGKPGRLQSFGSQRVKHDWTTTTTNKNWGPIVISLHLGTKGWCAIDKWKWKLLRVRKSCLRDVWIKDDKYQVSERVLVGWEDVDTGPCAQRDATCETSPKMQGVL